MKPTVVLVGRPNVGKSTLFNRLTRTRDALVADQPGLTRDRHYGHGLGASKPYLVVDTGGFEPIADEGILFEMARQTLQAVDEGDAVIFLLDARTGLTPQDKVIANRLRQLDKPVFLAVNKAEGMNREVVQAEFFELGLGAAWTISGAHGEGVRGLIERVLSHFPDADDAVETERSNHAHFAIIGRPNVGKSTLVNAILGEERVIAFDLPGTTRDSIHIDFTRNETPYTIIDTAGVRRKGKIGEAIEKFSVIKTLQAIEDSNVVVLVVDASLDIADQDAHLAGFALDAGRALVVAVNKWDAIDADQREQIRRDLSRKLSFLDFTKFHFISALKGKGVGELLATIDTVYASASANLSTPKLTRILALAQEKQAPPRVGVVRPKMRYAHQGGMNPPTVVIHGNALQKVPESYTRYLIHTFRRAFNLVGTPLRIEYRSSENPFNKQEDKPKRVRIAAGVRRTKRSELVQQKKRPFAKKRS